MRTLVSTGVVLALALTPSAAETRKQRIAILTLEHISADAVAHEVSDGMRARVMMGRFRYALAPNSSISQAQAKRDHSCASEATGCMATIGVALGADVLVYGRVERGGNGYRVVVKVLETKTKKVAAVAIETIASADPAVVRAAARRMIAKL